MAFGGVLAYLGIRTIPSYFLPLSMVKAMYLWIGSA